MFHSYVMYSTLHLPNCFSISNSSFHHATFIIYQFKKRYHLALTQMSMIITFLLSNVQFHHVYLDGAYQRTLFRLPESHPPTDHKRSCFAFATASFSGIFHFLSSILYRVRDQCGEHTEGCGTFLQ